MTLLIIYNFSLMNVYKNIPNIIKRIFIVENYILKSKIIKRLLLILKKP